MTLAALTFTSQIADALGYQLLYGRGVEGNPLMAAIDEPLTIFALKLAAGVVLATGVLALTRRERRRAASWLPLVGFVGCASELLAVLP